MAAGGEHSYKTGLHTPASDTDVMVVGSGNGNAQSGGVCAPARVLGVG